MVAVKKQKNSTILTGVSLILVAALFSAVSQLILKYGTIVTGNWSLVLYVLGFACATLGAIIMMIAFRFGEVSILQPIMAAAYVFSFILGFIFLGEPATWTKVIGILTIVSGCIFMGIPSKQKGEH
jgi:undecaprenyl phosphate-alpha-L-ara4N flippase subunit ArnE